MLMEPRPEVPHPSTSMQWWERAGLAVALLCLVASTFIGIRQRQQATSDDVQRMADRIVLLEARQHVLIDALTEADPEAVREIRAAERAASGASPP